MPSQQVTDALTQAKAFLDDTAGVPNYIQRAQNAFDFLEGNTALTADERQECYQTLVKNYVAGELQRSNNSGGQTLLRGNDENTTLMALYMKQYASEYMESVWQAGLNATAQQSLPGALDKVGTFSTIGSPLSTKDGKPIGDKVVKKLDDGSAKVAQAMVDTAEKNLSTLTPEAREFIKAAMEPAVDNGDVESANFIAANTIFLRGISSMVSDRAALIRDGDELKPEGAMLCNANVLVQTYANFINKEPGVIRQGPNGEITKPQDGIVAPLRTEEGLGRSKEAFDALSKGGQDLEDYMTKVGPPDGQKKQSSSVSEKATRLGALGAQGKEIRTHNMYEEQAQRREGALSAGIDRVMKLEKRLERLENNPNTSDRFKAFFKGGLKKAIAKTNASIAQEYDELATLAQNNPQLNLDGVIAKHGERVDMLRAVATNLSDAGAGRYVQDVTEGTKGTKVDRAVFNQMTKVEGRIDEVEKRIEVVKSVRDALNKKAPKVDDGSELEVSVGNGSTNLTQSTKSVLTQSGGGGQDDPTTIDQSKVNVPEVDDSDSLEESLHVESLPPDRELPPLPKVPNKITSKIQMFEDISKQGSVGQKTGIPKQGSGAPKEGQKLGQSQSQGKGNL